MSAPAASVLWGHETYSRPMLDEWTVAERLTLISQVNARAGGAPKFLVTPVWVQPGQSFRYDDAASALVVKDQNGGSTLHSCAYKTGPDAIR